MNHVLKERETTFNKVVWNSSFYQVSQSKSFYIPYIVIFVHACMGACVCVNLRIFENNFPQLLYRLVGSEVSFYSYLSLGCIRLFCYLKHYFELQ